MRDNWIEPIRLTQKPPVCQSLADCDATPGANPSSSPSEMVIGTTQYYGLALITNSIPILVFAVCHHLYIAIAITVVERYAPAPAHTPAARFSSSLRPLAPCCPLDPATVKALCLHTSGRGIEPGYSQSIYPMTAAARAIRGMGERPLAPPPPPPCHRPCPSACPWPYPCACGPGPARPACGVGGVQGCCGLA